MRWGFKEGGVQISYHAIYFLIFLASRNFGDFPNHPCGSMLCKKGLSRELIGPFPNCSKSPKEVFFYKPDFRPDHHPAKAKKNGSFKQWQCLLSCRAASWWIFLSIQLQVAATNNQV